MIYKYYYKKDTDGKRIAIGVKEDDQDDYIYLDEHNIKFLNSMLRLLKENTFSMGRSELYKSINKGLK